MLGCSVAAGPAGRALLAQVEALTGVTVTASTDKTGGAEGADWEMETHGLDVAKDYFDKEKIAAWKEAAHPVLLGALLVSGLLFGTSALLADEDSSAIHF